MSFSARHWCQAVSKVLRDRLGVVTAPLALIKALQCRKEGGIERLSEYGNDLHYPPLRSCQPLVTHLAAC